MKLLLQSNGGFSGFYSKFILIDTDLHKMVKTDGLMKDGLTGIKYIWDYIDNEKIPDIDDFGKTLCRDFNYDISLLECFLPTAKVVTNESFTMDDINYDVYLSSENVPYRKFRLNSSSYLENDALSAKLRKLFQTFL
mgnify:FL=1